MYDLGDDYYKNYTSNISKVTLNDLKTAADENIKLNNLAAVVVGNLSNELAEFEKLAELKGFSITVRKV